MFEHMRNDSYRAAKAAEEAVPKPEPEKLFPTEELTPEEMDRRAAAASQREFKKTQEIEFVFDKTAGEENIEMSDWREKQLAAKALAAKIIAERQAKKEKEKKF